MIRRWLSQTLAVSALSVRTIPQRASSSAVAMIGIAGVVIVFVAVLSIGEGFWAAMADASAPDRAIVMRTGADSEMTSGLPGPEVQVIEQAPGLLRVNNRPIASAELYVLVDLNKRSTGTAANVPLRGIGAEALEVRNEAHIVDGRMFQFGTNEAIVGRGANRQFSGVDLGSEFMSGNLRLRVVGIFESNGSVGETEIWCDSHLIQGVYERGNSYQSVLAKLDSPAAFDTFKNWLTTNPQLNVQVQREGDYYAQQSQVMSSLIRGIGYTIAVLMGVGAVFGAILTMYTAVSTRTREIATLRALGFNTASVLISVLAESLALAAIGGLLGGLTAYFAFNGYQTSTMNFQTFSQVAFAFRVTRTLMIQGVSYALMMGLVGGLMPAIKAARLPIATALRQL
ncbi:MAG TPA: ABC transporter permease [Vicinamibacterales bacterium]|nr:ABC transporter permease [Vicinamibacterales bacterium]